jgi:PST family polysaccharide transporter
VLQILCLVGVKQPLGASMGWVLTSLGRTDTLRRWGIFSGSLNLVAVIVGVQWGVIGVAVAYAIFSYVIHYHSVMIPSRLVDVTFKEYHLNVATVFVCGLVMMLVVFGVKLLLPDGWPHLVYLAIQTATGVLVYWGLLHGFKVAAYREMLDLFPELNRRRRSASH